MATSTRTPPTFRAEPTDTLILGAGPAGLALGACLRRSDADFEILEAGPAVGWAWHNHYDRLHLHTARRHSALPFMPFPESWAQYVPRALFVEYLERYAAHFRLGPRFGEQATLVRRAADGLWEVEGRSATSGERTLRRAAAVVVATGYNHEPHIPHWPGEHAFGGTIVHAREYRNPTPFLGRRVLVVGLGNTGAEIALDLAEASVPVTLAVRGPVNIVPRDFHGRSTQDTAVRMRRLPTRIRDLVGRAIARSVLGDLRDIGLRTPPYGPITQIERYGKLPVIDVGTVARIRAGDIALAPNPTGFSADAVRFDDGSVRPFDAVILATGYRSGLPALLEAEGVLDAAGYPAGDGGCAVPGLFFLGFARPKAGILREIALGAARVRDAVLAYVSSRRTPRR